MLAKRKFFLLNSNMDKEKNDIADWIFGIGTLLDDGKRTPAELYRNDFSSFYEIKKEEYTLHHILILVSVLAIWGAILLVNGS